MIDHDSIAPPPSLADILSSGEDLIGRVDFGSRLTTGPRGEQAGGTATRTRTPRVAAKPVAARPEPSHAEPETAVDAPQATEEGAKAAPRKPRKPRRASARATLRPAPKPVTPPAVEAPEVVDEAPVMHPVVDEHDVEQVIEPDPVVEALSFTEPPLPVGAFADAYDEYDDEHQDVDRGEPTTAYAEPPTRVAPRRELPGLTAPSVVPEEDIAYLGLSVEEVAESARARMRAAEVAHLRHLEAIENEAARRLELLTAQAELDAELIRLHARREAHAIVSAARARAGGAAGVSRAERRLAEVGSTFAHFAETLESSIESTTAPDPRHRP